MVDGGLVCVRRSNIAQRLVSRQVRRDEQNLIRQHDISSDVPCKIMRPYLQVHHVVDDNLEVGAVGAVVP